MAKLRPARWTMGRGGGRASGPATPAAGRFIDLFANAVAPLWPSALQDLDRPVIDPDVLEMDDEPIVARELDTDAQRSQLRDHFLRLAATLRENLVPPLLPGHSPRLAPTGAARSPKEAAEAAPPDRVHPYSRWVKHREVVRPQVSCRRRAISEPLGHARLREDPDTQFPGQGIYPDSAYAATAFRDARSHQAACSRDVATVRACTQFWSTAVTQKMPRPRLERSLAVHVSTHYPSSVTADEGGPIYYQQQILSTVSRAALGL